MNDSKQDKLTQQIKLVLDRSVDELDADTRYQLQKTRARVLNNKSSKNRWTSWSTFGGVSAFASICALAVFILIQQPQLNTNDTNMLTELDAELLEVDTNIELYEQFDFYVWLSHQESNG